MSRRPLKGMRLATVSEIETSEDRFLDGRVLVVQPATGYRAGMDAVLLAASLEASPGETLAEAGCGAGAVLLCAASRLGGATFAGFDRLGEHLALMERSACANGFGERVIGELIDIANRPGELENAFDQSFANPPFFRPEAVRAPAEGRRHAYLAETPLVAWVKFLHHITKPGGKITIIHRAAELAKLLALLDPRCGEIEILPVRPYPGAVAKRVLVRARKGLRSGDVKLLGDLDLADERGGPPSERAAELMTGAALEWR